MIRPALCLALAVSALLLARPAMAELEVCNETDLAASVAIGYSDAGTWTSEGWWRIAPGACLPVVTDPLAQRYYYWRATNAHGTFRTGDYFFCTSEQVFTIAGDDACQERGFDRLPFAEVDTGTARRFTVTLDPADAPELPVQPDALVADGATAPGVLEEAGQSRIEGQGVFSHCDAGDCMIVAEGRRVLVGSGRAQLLRLARNTPIRFVGRVHSREGSTDRIALASFEELPRDRFGPVRDALQGRWQALRSPGAVFEITGGLRQDMILGTPVFEATLDVVARCDGGVVGPALSFVYFSGGNDRLCWEVTLLEPDTLIVLEPGKIEETVFLRMN
ncbi:DUF1036 domain-containing protein [Cognatishimia sp. F0-27]|nr:DUF1036 domain-containing protein [Cognatishimia sp. F0-27]